MTRITSISFTLIVGFLLMFNVACSDAEDSGNNKGTIGLEQLLDSAEQARQKASDAGFEWNTIQPLLDKGRETMEKGDEALAHDLFSEAKAHAELAIAQANYADKHWRLLIPNSE